MSEPRVGQTRMQGGGVSQINADGTMSGRGGAYYEQVYLGARAARAAGTSVGWHDYNRTTSAATGRNEVRDGKVSYTKPANGGVSYGGQRRTAAARAVANNANRRRNR